MKMEGNTILITGGATGIGLALAESLLERGNEVIICGRRENRLIEVQNEHPGLHIRVCDVSDEDSRKSLFKWVTKNFKDLNILINNAGIQRAIDLKEGIKGLEGENEIKINLEATIYLSTLFIPFLESKKEAAIVNISSGLAITPLAAVPIYCATKAGVHTFTKCLRSQLSDTSIKVFEVLPPIVISELNMEYRKKVGTTNTGIKSDKCAASIVDGLEKDKFEIENPALENLKTATMKDIDKLFEKMNGRW
jgi:uncharacterized oxidoreductase